MNQFLEKYLIIKTINGQNAESFTYKCKNLRSRDGHNKLIKKKNNKSSYGLMPHLVPN